MDAADFHFEKPWALALAALAGVILFIALCWAERRRRRGLAGFAAAHLLARLTSGYSAVRRRSKDVALSLAFALLLACFAGPRWGVELTTQKGATEDVVFALDVSKSMLVSDMSPTRLARAKASIANFVRRKGTGNVGLVAFAGQAFLQCPLTRDYDAFFRTLEETDTGSIQVAGTDIGRALEEAELAFYPNRNRKLLIILTDGEDLEAGGVEMARKLKRNRLVVHTVGVGTPSGGPIRVISSIGSLETMKDAKGDEVMSRLDEKTLAEIADASGGRFIRLGQAGEGMEALRLAIEAGTDERNAGRRGIPREEWFIGAALLLLILESLTSTRRKEVQP
jgi:Ca-activated chloride channel family protein